MQSFINKLFRQDSDNMIVNKTHTTAKTIADYQPLLDLQDKRQLVQVDVLNNMHRQSYQSMVVRLDFFRKEIYLDAFTPLNPYNPIAIGDTLVLSHHDHGQILFVEGQLQNILTEDGEVLYVMNLPTEIGYKQRRFYRRLPVDKTNLVKMRLWSPLRIPWYSKVHNISAGGARLSVGGNLAPQLKNSIELPNCDIELNSGHNISCKATVKSFRYQRRPYEHTEISIEFCNLGYQQKNWLLQWVEFNSSVGMPRSRAS